MATLSSSFLTLADLASRTDHAGNLVPLINMLSQHNEVLDDMLWKEGNLTTGELTAQITGLPAVYYRLINAGVPRSKATTAQITDTTAMIEAYSLADKKLMDLSRNPAEARMQEDMTFAQAMNIEMARALFYGNSQTAPEQFTGLSPRFSTVNTATAGNAVNVIDAGGTGSTNTSIWLVCWGPSSVYGIYPKGTTGGLMMEDVTTPAPVLDANGNPYQAYQTHFVWNCGLTVKNWQYVVRIANIDVNNLTTTNLAADLLNIMIDMVQAPPSMPSGASASGIATPNTAQAGEPLSYGKPAIYCNRRIKSALMRQSRNNPHSFLNLDSIQGRPVLSYLGVPIRVTDALINNEARVV